MAIVLAVAWIVCGVLAYGLEKDWGRQVLLNTQVDGVPIAKHGLRNEFHCIFTGCLGPLAVVLILIANPFFGYTIGLTYRMPKKLK